MTCGTEPEPTLYPWYYTKEESGNWLVWSGGLVKVAELEASILFGGSATTIINGVEVHSLAFESPIAGMNGINLFARWDSRNGWTTTIEAARQAWPQGHHGEVPIRGRVPLPKGP